jgi:hypothetical protein
MKTARTTVVLAGLAVAGASWLFAADPHPHYAPKGAITNELASIQLPTVAKPKPAQPTPGPAEDSHLDKMPVRATEGLDLTRMSWSYDCMECHKLLPAKWTDLQRVEHRNITLNHGANRFCINCHHASDRTAFNDYDGSIIPRENVVQLCGRCHGPTYRDWTAGVHGRKNGYWLKSKGPQTRLRCIQCHDPHSPKFKPIKPQAPPSYPKRAAQPERKDSHED